MDHEARAVSYDLIIGPEDCGPVARTAGDDGLAERPCGAQEEIA